MLLLLVLPPAANILNVACAPANAAACDVPLAFAAAVNPADAVDPAVDDVTSAVDIH